MRRRDIVRMWSQIVHQTGKEKYTSEEWQESYESFWSCMTTAPDPFIHIENVDQLLKTWAARSERKYPTNRRKRKSRVKGKRGRRNKINHEPIDQNVNNLSLMSQHLKESQVNHTRKPTSKAFPSKGNRKPNRKNSDGQEIDAQNQKEFVLKEYGQVTKISHPMSKLSGKNANQLTKPIKEKDPPMRHTLIEKQGNENLFNTTIKIRNPPEGVQRRWTRSQSAGKLGKLQFPNSIHQQQNVKLRRSKLAVNTNPRKPNMPSIDMTPAIIPDTKSIFGTTQYSDEKRNIRITQPESFAEYLKRSKDTCRPGETVYYEPDFPASSQLKDVDVIDHLPLTTPPLLADDSNAETLPSGVMEIVGCLQNSNNDSLRDVGNHVSSTDQRILDHLPKETLRNNEYEDETTSLNGDDEQLENANYYSKCENLIQNELLMHHENKEPQSACETSEQCDMPQAILPATNATEEISSLASVLDIENGVLLRKDRDDQQSEIHQIANEQRKQPMLLKHIKIQESKCSYKRKRNSYDDVGGAHSGSCDQCEQEDLDADQPRKISRKIANQPTQSICADKIQQPQIVDQTANVKLNLSQKLITSNASSIDMSPATIPDTQTDSGLILSSDDKRKASIRLTESQSIAESSTRSEETFRISKRDTCLNDTDFPASSQLQDMDVFDQVHCSTDLLGENTFLSGVLTNDRNTITRLLEIDPCLQNSNNETLSVIDYHITDQWILDNLPKELGGTGLNLETLGKDDYADHSCDDDVLSVNTSWDGDDELFGIENDNDTTLNQHKDRTQNSIVIQQKNKEPQSVCEKSDECVKPHPVLSAITATKKTHTTSMPNRYDMQKSALLQCRVEVQLSEIPGTTKPMGTNFQQQQANLQGTEHQVNNQEIEHQSRNVANSNIIHTVGRELGDLYLGYKNTSNLFAIRCWRFLDGKCNEICCYHSLRDPRGVQHYLNYMETDKLCDIYSTVLRHGILFRKYFMTFGEIYGNRGMISHLLKMVEDCSLYMAYSAPIIMNMYHLFLRFKVSPQIAVFHFMKHLWVPYIGKLYPSLTKNLLQILATADWYNYTSGLKNLFCSQEFPVPKDFIIYIANNAIKTNNKDLILKVWDLASHCPIDGNNYTLISVMEMLKNV